MLMAKFVFRASQVVLRTVWKLNTTKKKGATLLSQLENEFNGQFEKQAFNKASKFQSIQQLLINDPFCELAGRLSTKEESLLNQYYFALTGVYDDIIDQNSSIGIARLDTLLNHPDQKITTQFNERILVGTYQYLLKHVQDPLSYQNIIHSIHQAQKDSLQQFNPQITPAQIIDITQRKGGFSLLMCRYHLNLPQSNALNECWYHLGGVIQMTNDLFDIYKDLQEGIVTFCNKQRNLKEISDIYHQQIQLFYTSLSNLPFEVKKKHTLQIKLSFIPAFGMIALENLRKIKGSLDQLPDFTQLERKALIIDMEKPINIYKLLYYAYKLNKRNVLGK